MTDLTGNDLMSREEMIRRLNDGENPVELSIEKWKRVRAIPLAEQANSRGLGSSACALCYVNDGKCGACKLREVTGDACIHEEGNHWGDALNDIWDQKDRGGVDRLIEMLEKCREVEPMSGEEMVRRIEAGEDPVELSIEKWKRIKEIYLDRNVTDFTHGNTCPLCYVYRPLGCGECMLVQKTGGQCHQEDTWIKAAKDVEERVDRGGLNGMIRLLEECEEKNKKDEIMDGLLRVHTKLILLSSNCERIGLKGTGMLLRSMVGEIELVIGEMKEEEEKR